MHAPERHWLSYTVHMKKYLLPALAVSTLFLVGCSTAQPDNSGQASDQSQAGDQQAPSDAGCQQAAAPSQTYTMADVATHNTPTDCWVVMRGKVYNLSNYTPPTPPPNSNFKLPDFKASCGQDVSTQFGGQRPGGFASSTHGMASGTGMMTGGPGGQGRPGAGGPGGYGGRRGQGGFASSTRPQGQGGTAGGARGGNSLQAYLVGTLEGSTTSGQAPPNAPAPADGSGQ